MPWHVQRHGPRWCVHKGHKGDNGPVVKCHSSRDDAEAHLRALYANAPEARSESAIARNDLRVSRRAWRAKYGFSADDQPDFSTGMMVALPIPPDLASQLAVEGGLSPEELHITLGYMGDMTDTPLPDIARLHSDLAHVASRHLPLSGQLGGIGVFPRGDEGHPIYVPADVPGVNELALDVWQALSDNSLPARRDHGFTPHVTISYHASDDPPAYTPVDPSPVTFDRIMLKIGSDAFHYGPGVSMNPQTTLTTNTTSATLPNLPPTVAEQMKTLLADISSGNGKFEPIRLYFREGERTPDRRFIDLGAMNFDRKPPYPIRLQTTQPESGGHAGAVICGVINSYFEDGPTKVFDGFLDLTQLAGQQALQLIENRTMQTWSPDLGDSIAYREDLEDGTHVIHYASATYLGATLCALPALGSATVALLNDDGSFRVEPIARANIAPTPTTLVACASDGSPPTAFFSDPQLSELQRWVSITPQGRIFGHVAGYDECHIGYLGRCITIDEVIPGGFEYACGGGYVVTAEGTKIGVGPLCVAGGHAPEEFGAEQARKYYDNPDWAVADVVYGVDAHGIWFSGALRPDASELQIRRLRAHGVSLDAREIGTQLTMIGACCVNVMGYPKVRARLLASAVDETPRIATLVAAGGRPLPDPALYEEQLADDVLAAMTAKIDTLEVIIKDAGLMDEAFAKLATAFD